MKGPKDTMQKQDTEQQFDEHNSEAQESETETEQTQIGEEDYSEEFDSDDEDSGDKKTKWTDGDPVTFVRVRFPGNSKTFPFIFGKRRFAYGQKVVAMSDRGMTVGYINSLPYTVPFNKGMLPIKSIVKAASEEDILEQKGHAEAERKAEASCIRLINKLELDMVLTHVEFIQFGKKAVFYFTAPSRVDFRELVKQLVGELKMRIELRQISVRDRAAALGGIGACGLQTCCSSFLKNYGHVSIKMAKNQNLALIPSKINGVCGQLKCCIKYEDDVYSEKRKKLPREGSFIQTKNGDTGKVTKLHILLEQFEMLTEEGKFRRYVLDQFKNGNQMPKEYKFPERFDHIVNETSEIIGYVAKQTKTNFDPFYDLEEDDEFEDVEEGEDDLDQDQDQETDNGQDAELDSSNNEQSTENTSPNTEESFKNESSTSDDEKKDRPRNNNRNRNNRNRNRNRNKNNPNQQNREGQNQGQGQGQGQSQGQNSGNRNRNNKNRRRNNKGNNRNPKSSE
ncbi:MAG: hypothetical protein EP319_03870 [Deltaproteobacteria bacterium]|nr:MAG: hypothetical protein EP319_03870 [Deltaproteobacteria bacterium]